MHTDYTGKWNQASSLSFKLDALNAKETAARQALDQPHRFDVKISEITRALTHSTLVLHDAIILVEGELLNLGPERTKQIVDTILEAVEATRNASVFKKSLDAIAAAQNNAVEAFAMIVQEKSFVLKEKDEGQRVAVEGLLKQVAHYESLYEWVRSRTIATMRERALWLETAANWAPEGKLKESVSFVQSCALMQRNVEEKLGLARSSLDDAPTMAERFVARVESRDVMSGQARNIRAMEELMLLREFLDVDPAVMNHETVNKMLSSIRTSSRVSEAKDKAIQEIVKFKIVIPVNQIKADVRKLREKFSLDSRMIIRDFKEVQNLMKTLAAKGAVGTVCANCGLDTLTSAAPAHGSGRRKSSPWSTPEKAMSIKFDLLEQPKTEFTPASADQPPSPQNRRTNSQKRVSIAVPSHDTNADSAFGTFANRSFGDSLENTFVFDVPPIQISPAQTTLPLPIPIQRRGSRESDQSKRTASGNSLN